MNAMIVHVNTDKTSSSKLALLTLVLMATIFGGYIMLESQSVNRIYESVLANREETAVKLVDIPGSSKQLVVPNWSLFTPGNIWSLVSHTEELPDNFKADSLVTSPVPHAHDATQISSRIAKPLSNMVEAARNEDIDLMLSSAYRSVAEQQAIYDDFVETKGREMADLYVAKPGTSEHHTGLAIDFADASDKCQQDSNTCNLSPTSAQWLANNAHKYGFVLRYPEGKKPITGIAFEPWHYRYVGPQLAKAVYDSELTLDEVLEQIYPAYAIE